LNQKDNISSTSVLQCSNIDHMRDTVLNLLEALELTGYRNSRAQRAKAKSLTSE
jgi:hypothetical protein